MGAQFIVEAMREEELANIEFSDSVVGRQAYMKDSNLAVWEVILIAKDHEMDVDLVSTYFRRNRDWVLSAFNYYEMYADEIDPVLEDSHSMTFEKLRGLLPDLETYTYPLINSEPAA